MRFARPTINRARQWLCLAAFCSASGVSAATIQVFAAASLSDSLKAIAAGYEKQTGDRIAFNFGASGLLARQIEEGAPADIFFSADEARMDSLDNKGLILKNTRQSRLGNSLVIVIAADSDLPIRSANDFTNATVKRIALADPKTVPAGIYAREYLEKIQLWTAVKPKIIPTDNVRAALAAVESGNVEAGMVYKTDAGISRKVKIAWDVPVGETPGISYPMAVVKDSREPDAARGFLKHLASDEAGRVFVKFGFIVRK